MDLRHPTAISLLTDLLARNVAVRFAVTGDSMRPLLRGGETILLRQVDPDRIRRGDLLLCQYSEPGGVRLLLHRVVAIRQGGGLPALIQTQGDAVGTPDESITGSQVLGRVCAILGAQLATEPLSLDTRSQRARALLIALRQRALWRARLVYARLRRLGPTNGQSQGPQCGISQAGQRDSVPGAGTHKS